MRGRMMLHLSLIVFLALWVGCTSKPSDEQIQKDIQTKAAADPEIKDANVAVEAKQGKVKLTGKAKKPEVTKEYEKIAKEEPGVSDVDDEVTVDPDYVASAAMAPVTAPVVAPAPVPAPPPPPPPQPIVVPEGTPLTVKLGQTLSSKTNQVGSVFTATMANPITINGETVIPEGSEASGVVREVKKAGRFKGGAVLNIELTSIAVHGYKYHLVTTAVGQTSTGKGKRTAGMMVGGAGAGAAIGGIAGGGKGAAIGALAGVAAGTVGAATGNRDIELPAESAFSFTLAQPLTLKP